MKNYLLVCDERGTKSIKSTRRTFTIGGIALPEEEQTNVLLAWSGIKQNLCGRHDVELKWSHFFSGHHQKSGDNPLLNQDSERCRQDAMWALNDLFESANVFPLTVIVRKDNVDDSLLELTRKGKKIISIRFVLSVLLGQFALYLREQDGKKGEIWCDQLGSLQEQNDLKSAFASTFDNLGNLLPPLLPYVKAVNPHLSFFDSSQKPIIQVADFVSGVIWAAAEGDSWFLRKHLEKYTLGRKRTYGIAFLEA
ncbi:MAG: DUF3800 domain-containing protein [Anaerolineales bacterium]|nr:DUF3800 domain-containing protein [Anaerolineales bacterium]